jgi:hypothetical protein
MFAGLVSVFRELNVIPHVIQHMKEPMQRHRPREPREKSHMASVSERLAGGKGVRITETNRTVAQDPQTVSWELARGGGHYVS